MNLLRFAEHADELTKLGSSHYGAALRLSDYWNRGVPKNAKQVTHMLQDTGVRGRVVDISGEKLPNVKFLSND